MEDKIIPQTNPIFQDSLPIINSSLVIGPEEYISGRIMHYAKLVGVNRHFRLGQKEVFVLTRLNGKFTYLEISTSYAIRFGKRLSGQSWVNILRLFRSKNLTTGSVSDDVAPSNSEETSIIRSFQHGPFSRKLIRWNPNLLLENVVPSLKWLIGGKLFLIWSLLILACEIVVVKNIHLILKEFKSIGAGLPLIRIACLVSIILIMTVLHESAHAVVCKRYGGEVREVGLLIRYFVICAYARIDDIVLMKRRRDRLYVLLAGPLTGLSIIPIALIMWKYSEANSVTHRVALDLLVGYNFACLFQFLPLMKMDGYYMLAQLIKMPELRTDSYKYLSGLIKEYLFSIPKVEMPSRDCASYVKPVYVIYGTISALASTVFIIGIIVRYSYLIIPRLGKPETILLVIILAVMASFRLYNEFVGSVKTEGRAAARKLSQ
jgi:putative peptide zinc metalloprotease protein